MLTNSVRDVFSFGLADGAIVVEKVVHVFGVDGVRLAQLFGIDEVTGCAAVQLFDLAHGLFSEARMDTILASRSSLAA
jgi:hypothetical protein